MRMTWLGAGAAVALLAAGPTWAQPAPGARDDLAKAPRFGAWGFDLAGRDPSVAPGQDFFAYANGVYQKALVIPDDRVRYGVPDALNKLSQDRLHGLLDKIAADRAASGDQARVGALYRSFLDEAKVESLGAKPMAADLAAIRTAKTKTDLARLMGQSQKRFGGSFFNAYVSIDAKDPEHYAVYLGQGGLGLPDRDYYLEPSFAAKKSAYEAYVAKLLTLAGWPAPAANAKAIVALETEIAQVSWTRAERRDDNAMYNAMEAAKLSELAPGFDWPAFLKAADMGGVKTLVVSEKTAFPKIAAIYAKTPAPVLKAWAAFHLADQAAPYLSKAFDQAHYEFRDKTLSGQQAQPPRWRRGVRLVDGQIGEALGRLYVAAYFPPESKAKMLALVGDIKTAMRGRIEQLDWMSPDTKARARDKLDLVRVKIGYPDKWRDYAGLTITDDDLYGDVNRASAFDYDFRVARLGGPVDRDEWGMTPPTINAYFNPPANEIVFPAAILQPPFFDPDGDPAINYGGIGGVIGHELTHGFDDQGRQYDGHGKLTDWWTAEDAAKFKAQAAKLGLQYEAFAVLPGAKIKGDQTMGENIADLGGLLLALDAYHASLKGGPAPIVDGLTGDQRVFLGWAQVYRGKTREDALRRQLVSDPHSPNEARVDLPMRNVDAFYAAFGVKPGDAMYVAPADRVRIW